MTDAAPALTVVVPAVRGAGPLAACLESLEAQRGAGEIETIVVSRLPAGRAEEAARGRPRVRVVPGDGLTIPQMRAKGIAQARAPVVAMLADDSTVPPGWAEAMRRGHESGAPVVGGPIRNGAFSPVAWAAFLLEYGEHMPPLPEGPAASLPGNNVSYSRAALEACADVLSRGLWETFLHRAMAAKGFAMRREPAAEAVHAAPVSFRRYAATRWHLARSYAGMWAREGSAGRRLLSAAGTAVLPELLVWRLFRQVLARPGQGYAAALAKAFPFVLVFLAVWTLGEFVGYVSGEGNSTLKVL